MQANSTHAGRITHRADSHIWPLSLVAPDGPRGLAFRIQGIGEQAPRRPGIFIYSKRAADGSWQALYIGESDNLRVDWRSTRSQAMRSFWVQATCIFAT